MTHFEIVRSRHIFETVGKATHFKFGKQINRGEY